MFIDDHSRYGHIYFMKYKSKVLERFKEFRFEVEKKSDKSIKVLGNGVSLQKPTLGALC